VKACFLVLATAGRLLFACCACCGASSRFSEEETMLLRGWLLWLWCLPWKRRRCVVVAKGLQVGEEEAPLRLQEAVAVAVGA
jgi:hypothetical protein